MRVDTCARGLCACCGPWKLLVRVNYLQEGGQALLYDSGMSRACVSLLAAHAFVTIWQQLQVSDLQSNWAYQLTLT